MWCDSSLIQTEWVCGFLFWLAIMSITWHFILNMFFFNLGTKLANLADVGLLDLRYSTATTKNNGNLSRARENIHVLRGLGGGQSMYSCSFLNI